MSWVTAQRFYQGFPLFLRRPIDVDTPENRRNFPDLVVLAHVFKERLPDGRPESRYNKTLEDFDHDLCSVFGSDQSGVPILIETFGGKRTYYFCASPDADVSSLVAGISQAYPNERLIWAREINNGWTFLDRYAADFF